MKFLNLNKPIFILIFRNNEGENYEYTTLKINLNKFYEIHSNFSSYIITKKNEGVIDMTKMIIYKKHLKLT